MEIFNLGDYPHVELCNLLKLHGWSESCATAKQLIINQLVKVDGNIDTRKRRKIIAGQIVSLGENQVKVEI